MIVTGPAFSIRLGPQKEVAPMPITRPLSLSQEEPQEGGSDDPILYLEDIQVGDRWQSGFREISQGDVEQFAELTGDHDTLNQ